MKKTLLIAAALVLAGCGEKKAEAPAAEAGMSAPAEMPMSDTTMVRDSAQ
jgi:hypothetical protein